MKNYNELAQELEAINISCVEVSNDFAKLCAQKMQFDVVFGFQAECDLLIVDEHSSKIKCDDCMEI